MYTVYAFCKAVDSAVDEPPAGSNPKEELRRWRSELELVYSGRPTSPLMISLAHHVNQLSIPKAYFDELIKGVEMDLSRTRYRTFEELSLYCYRVASIVGLICLHVFGPTSPHAQDYAVDLGMAFQLTNILRDLSADADQGRIYLPQEDLEKFGYSETDLLKHIESPALHDLIPVRSDASKELLHEGAGGTVLPAQKGPSCTDGGRNHEGRILPHPRSY
jgi:phytoene synthase